MVKKLDDSLLKSILPALEQSFVGVVLVNGQNEVVFFNEAAESLWGISKDDILNQPMTPLLPTELHAVHPSYLERHRQQGQSRVEGMSRELKIRRADGSEIWANFSLSKVDVEGDIHYLALVLDVTEEVKQREQNELLLIAVNNADRAMLVLDTDRRIVQCNKAFSTLSGYELAEVYGFKPTEILKGSRTAPETLKRIQDNAAIGRRFTDEAQGITKNGEFVWLKISFIPVYQTGGAIKNFVVVLYDITEKRLIQDLEHDLLEAVTSSIPFEEMGDFLCHKLEELMPNVRVTLNLVQDNQMVPWAYPSFDERYARWLHGRSIGEGVGSCGTAAYRGQPVFTDDLSRHPFWKEYHDFLQPYQVYSSWSYPIKNRDSVVIGTFTFYFSEQRPAKLDLLEKAASSCLELSKLAIEREDNRKHIQNLIRFDTLTGLPNQKALAQFLQTLLSATPTPAFFVLKIGLDHFRDVVSSLGHQAADAALITIAQRLQEIMGKTDFLCRTEGNQFTLIKRETHEAQVSLFAQRLLQTVATPIQLNDIEFVTQASVGISRYCPEINDYDELLTSAQNAMFKARELGGATFRFFSPEMNTAAKERLLLSSALRKAISESQLELYYQPQIDAQAGKLHGVEALARWNHEELGFIRPDKFIALAEEIGVIEELGRWAIETACAQLSHWKSQNVTVPSVSVNLSATSFHDRELPVFIEGLLSKFDLKGKELTLEVTESAAMEFTPSMQQILTQIRHLGVGLSVDDFGTGFSCLSNLVKLPITEVKIDRSFVVKSLEDHGHAALVNAILNLGKNLGLTVVAEGVETQEQLAHLLEQSNPIIQGYFFAKPMPDAELRTWLTQSDLLSLERI